MENLKHKRSIFWDDPKVGGRDAAQKGWWSRNSIFSQSFATDGVRNNHADGGYQEHDFTGEY